MYATGGGGGRGRGGGLRGMGGRAGEGGWRGGEVEAGEGEGQRRMRGEGGITGGSCQKYNFCRNKTFVASSILCRDKHVFVFCRNKSMLVTTKYLSRQN